MFHILKTCLCGHLYNDARENQTFFKVREFYFQGAKKVVVFFWYRLGNFVLKIFNKPSAFLVIHRKNSHPAWSGKIVLQSKKSQNFFFFSGRWEPSESKLITNSKFTRNRLWCTLMVQILESCL